MAKAPRSIARSSLVNSLLVILLLGVSAEVCWIAFIYGAYQKELGEATKSHVVRQEAIIKDKVDSVVDYLDQYRALGPRRLEKSLEYIVRSTCATVTDVKTLVKLTGNIPLGHLFVFDLTTDKWLLEPKTSDSEKGALASAFKKEGVDLKKGLFLSYEGKTQSMRCFVQESSLSGNLIGSLGSVEELRPILQQEAEDYINSIRFGKDGYIHAFRYDGLYLCHIDKDIVGANKIDVTDPNGVKIVQELLRLAKSGGGYLRYYWKKPSIGKDVEKLAYARAFEPWQWVISTGVYMDDLRKVSESKKAELRRKVFANIGHIVILIGLAMIVTLYISSRFAQDVRKEFDMFESFFHRAAVKSEHVDESGLRFGEFKSLAKAVNRTIDKLNEANEALKVSEERLRTTLDATADGLWEFNYGTRPDFLSPRMATMVGYEVSKCEEGMSFITENIHPDDEILWRKAMAKLERDGNDELSVQFRLGAKDGTWHHILSRGKCVARDDEGKPLRTVGTHTDVTERVKAEEKHALTQYVVDKSYDIVYMLDDGRKFRYVNDRALEALGYSLDDFSQMSLANIHVEEDEELWQAAWTDVEEKGHFTFTSTLKRKDGKVIPVEVMASHVRFGGVGYCFAFARDITQRRHLEGQLRQSQKMEAVGRLAGGVAHDFNNQLTVILGFCSVLEMDESIDGHTLELVKEIEGAARRSAQLTGQLLAFSRKQVLKPAVLQVNDVVTNLKKTLHRLIGEDVSLKIDLTDDATKVKVDGSQMEQAIINLCLNARDAMPDGGQLTIETGYSFFNDKVLPSGDTASGPYVTLAISDTGSGMDEVTLNSIFEPFFTTKEMGKGTGLGLAMVYGFVRQSGGHIDIESELGSGSCFWIYLPLVEEAEQSRTIQEEKELDTPKGETTILVVEDERAVRHLTATILKKAGYRVIEASGPVEAMEISDEFGGKIDLLLTDVVMPGQCGPELAKQLVEKRPVTKVLYMTGYIDRAAASLDIDDSSIKLVTKPFTPKDLRIAVIDALASEGQTAAS